MSLPPYLQGVDPLAPYLDRADVVDIKCVEGAASLRSLIAGMLSYYPWWLVMLYRIRQVLVGLLGLVKHEAPEELPDLRPEDIAFTPGAEASFFIVRSAEEEHFWIAETPADKHLKAYFAVVREPLTTALSRFYVITSVYYQHWTGPVYFNLIRPFHHLVVARMARYGVIQPG